MVNIEFLFVETMSHKQMNLGILELQKSLDTCNYLVIACPKRDESFGDRFLFCYTKNVANVSK